MSSLSQEDHLLLLRKQTILYAELVRMERDFEKKRQEKIAEMFALREQMKPANLQQSGDTSACTDPQQAKPVARDQK
jgi:vacuolar-type H+-ATPase subunit D/Vma8